MLKWIILLIVLAVVMDATAYLLGLLAPASHRRWAQQAMRTRAERDAEDLARLEQPWPEEREVIVAPPYVAKSPLARPAPEPVKPKRPTVGERATMRRTQVAPPLPPIAADMTDTRSFSTAELDRVRADWSQPALEEMT